MSLKYKCPDFYIINRDDQGCDSLYIVFFVDVFICFLRVETGDLLCFAFFDKHKQALDRLSNLETSKTPIYDVDWFFRFLIPYSRYKHANFDFDPVQHFNEVICKYRDLYLACKTKKTLEAKAMAICEATGCLRPENQKGCIVYIEKCTEYRSPDELDDNFS